MLAAILRGWGDISTGLCGNPDRLRLGFLQANQKLSGEGSFHSGLSGKDGKRTMLSWISHLQPELLPSATYLLLF